MTSETNFEAMPQTEAWLNWEPPMPPSDLIFDNGEPLQTNRHRIATNTLIRSLQQVWADRNDFFTGGNMFIYYSSGRCYQAVELLSSTDRKSNINLISRSYDYASATLS